MAERGMFQFNGNFDIYKSAPLDARIVLPKKSDLLALDSWPNENDAPYIYNGMIVAIEEDFSLYMLVDKINWNNNDYSGWKKIEIDGLKQPTNLIKNSNFEIGQGSGPDSTESWAYAAMGGMGTVSTFHTIDGYPGTNIAKINYLAIKQDMVLEQGKTYTLSFLYATGTGSSCSVSQCYVNYNYNQQWANVVDHNSCISSSGSYGYMLKSQDISSGLKKAAITFKYVPPSPSSTHFGALVFAVTTNTSGGDFYIAQIKLEEGSVATDYDKFEDNFVTIQDLNDAVSNLSSGESDTMISITYSELKTLRDNAELSPGVKYRITDYETTTGSSGTMSAGNKFDIIVTASSNKDFHPVASATHREGDTYFAQADLGAWKIWYDIDNDTSKYAWATSTGKGVIYRMIDEHNNDCPYDFKNIKFYTTSIGTFTPSDKYFYTFSYCSSITSSTLVDYSNLATFRGCYNNVIKPYFVSSSSTKSVQTLNAIVNRLSSTSSSYFRDNVFGYNCYNIYTVGSCYYNKIGNSCNNIKSTSAGMLYNTFGNNCNNITFGSSGSNNTFGNNCSYVYLGGSYNTFGNYCTYIYIGTSNSYNTFGNNCKYIYIKKTATATTTTDSLSYVERNIIESDCAYIRLYCTAATSSSNKLQNLFVSKNASGSSSSNINTYELTNSLNSKDVIRIPDNYIRNNSSSTITLAPYNKYLKINSSLFNNRDVCLQATQLKNYITSKDCMSECTLILTNNPKSFYIGTEEIYESWDGKGYTIGSDYMNSTEPWMGLAVKFNNPSIGTTEYVMGSENFVYDQYDYTKISCGVRFSDKTNTAEVNIKYFGSESLIGTSANGLVDISDDFGGGRHYITCKEYVVGTGA